MKEIPLSVIDDKGCRAQTIICSSVVSAILGIAKIDIEADTDIDTGFDSGIGINFFQIKLSISV